MPTKAPTPPLDPKEALQHVRSLVVAATESDQIEVVHKLLNEALKVVDKALPRKRSLRHGD